MKTEFESRIEFNRIKLHMKRMPAFHATVYWNGQLYETVRRTKGACVADLKLKAGVK